MSTLPRIIVNLDIISSVALYKVVVNILNDFVVMDLDVGTAAQENTISGFTKPPVIRSACRACESKVAYLDVCQRDAVYPTIGCFPRNGATGVWSSSENSVSGTFPL